MSARILVVDDIAANVKLLEAKLQANYYIVLTASDGFEALEIAKEELPDLILLDVMMPKMDGFEVCRRLKDDPRTAHIPVVMVTALDQPSDRVQGLEAGADDFLTKPANNLTLFSRVRSLVRMKRMLDELKLRDETCRELGVDVPSYDATDETPYGHVLLVDDMSGSDGSIVRVIVDKMGLPCRRVSTKEEAFAAANELVPAVLIVNSSIASYDALRLCSELQAQPFMKNSAAIMMVQHQDYQVIADSLDMGASDYIMRPVDENELIARVRSQLLRQRYAARLKELVDSSLRMAVVDPLTGLHNRRYAGQHMNSLLKQAATSESVIAALVLDIDRFKLINDTYGHGVGDEVLKEFAERIRFAIRGVDMAARIGGEEFLIVMAQSTALEAASVAERLREQVAERPFVVQDGEEKLNLDVTVSIGIADSDGSESPDVVLKRADEALYRSKNEGRNRVTLSAA